MTLVMRTKRRGGLHRAASTPRWSGPGRSWPRHTRLGVLIVLGVTLAGLVAFATGRQQESGRTELRPTGQRARTPLAAPVPTDGPLATPGSGPSGAPGAVGSSAPAPGTPATTGPGSCAATVLARLSVEQRAGQVLMVGVPVTDPGQAVDLVRRARLGGVFLAGRSTAAATTLRGELAAVQAAALRDTGVRVHIAVDQEGGAVQTLRGPGLPAIPSAVEQSRGAPATLPARTDAWARALASAGVTMDLAPVADTVPAATAAANPPIGAFDRQYGATPDAVAADIGVVVPALQRAGVLATVKHFPGLGRVRHNTDTSTEAVDADATPDDPYLAPFRAGIAAGAGAVMVSSASYPRLDPASLAAFSRPVITGLLRGRLGYQGMVVSDDLGAAEAVRSVPVGERAVRFVAAGGDLVLTVRPADAGPMAAALAAEAGRSPAFAQRLAEAATAVLVSKERLGLLDCAGAPVPAPSAAGAGVR